MLNVLIQMHDVEDMRSGKGEISYLRYLTYTQTVFSVWTRGLATGSNSLASIAGEIR